MEANSTGSQGSHRTVAPGGGGGGDDDDDDVTGQLVQDILRHCIGPDSSSCNIQEFLLDTLTTKDEITRLC